MIDKAYKETYRKIFSALSAKANRSELDECGIPSYMHRIPLMSWLFWQRVTTALAICGDLHGKSVLDFGCGAGVLFRYLRDNNCRVAACDNEYDQIALSVAQTLNMEVSVSRDLSSFRGRHFDVIFALDVLEHVEDLPGILADLLELSAKQTRLVVSGPTENFLYKLGRWLAGFSGHYHRRDIYDVESGLKSTGFHLITMRTLYPPVPLFRVSSWSSP